MKYLSLLALLLISSCGSGESAAHAKVAETSEIESADPNALVDLQRSLVTKTSAVLGGVTDAAGAENAKAALETLADQAEAMQARRDELMGTVADDPLAFGQATMAMMDEVGLLSEQLARLEDVEGVRAVLEEPVQRILDSFGSAR